MKQLLLAFCLVSCNPTVLQTAAIDSTPGMPPVTGCTPGVYACDGDVPTVCSADYRAIPVLPVDSQGVQEHCPRGCIVETLSAIAHCQ